MIGYATCKVAGKADSIVTFHEIFIRFFFMKDIVLKYVLELWLVHLLQIVQLSIFKFFDIDKWLREGELKARNVKKKLRIINKEHCHKEVSSQKHHNWIFSVLEVSCNVVT